MSMGESVSYLKGLAEGLNIDKSTSEGKLLLAIVDVLDDMAAEIAEIEEAADEQAELLDIIDEDLGSLEEDFYGDEDEDDDEDCCDGDLYEVTCPNCGDEIYLDEDMLLEGNTNCPNCGEKLEFDFDCCDCGCEDDEDCGCGCGCEH